MLNHKQVVVFGVEIPGVEGKAGMVAIYGQFRTTCIDSSTLQHYIHYTMSKDKGIEGILTTL
jgi:hypothetical protein